MWRFHNQNSGGCYKRTWCRVPDVVEKWTSEGEGSPSGIHVKMKISWALKVAVTWDVILTWLWNKDGLLLSLWTNFAGLEEIIMTNNVGCSSKALQVLALRLGWTSVTVIPLPGPFISALHLYLREESESPPACAFCPREDGILLWHLGCSLYCMLLWVPKGVELFCSKCHDDLPLCFQSLLNTAFSRAVIELDMK